MDHSDWLIFVTGPINGFDLKGRVPLQLRSKFWRFSEKNEKEAKSKGLLLASMNTDFNK